jgi:hypothetical protein
VVNFEPVSTVGIRTIDRRVAGSLNPSCAYSGNEWGVVSPGRKQKTAKADSTNQVYRKGGCQINIKDFRGNTALLMKLKK